MIHRTTTPRSRASTGRGRGDVATAAPARLRRTTPFGRRSRRGGRARRGDVRAGALLALLAEEPQHGYQLMRQLDERTGGVWRPSPGSVYPTLAQLEDEGLVTSVEADGRKVFTLTEAGQAEVAAHDGPAPWDEVARGGTALDVRPMVMAARRCSVTGDAAQIEAARKVIAEPGAPST